MSDLSKLYEAIPPFRFPLRVHDDETQWVILDSDRCDVATSGYDESYVADFLAGVANAYADGTLREVESTDPQPLADDDQILADAYKAGYAKVALEAATKARTAEARIADAAAFCDLARIAIEHPDCEERAKACGAAEQLRWLDDDDPRRPHTQDREGD